MTDAGVDPEAAPATPSWRRAGYLGPLAEPGPGGVVGAALTLVAIFLPGFLLLLGVLPLWDQLRRRPIAQAAMRGANAAVVGILAAGGILLTALG